MATRDDRGLPRGARAHLFAHAAELNAVAVAAGARDMGLPGALGETAGGAATTREATRPSSGRAGTGVRGGSTHARREKTRAGPAVAWGTLCPLSHPKGNATLHRRKEPHPMPLRLTSTITSAGRLEVRLVDVETRAPGADEVVIRVEASPINPSDLGLLFGPADLSRAKVSGNAGFAVLTAPIPAGLLPAAAARFDVPMAAGNEGAGVVVDAGASDAAQALLGKTVAVLGREMYSQFRVVPADQCLVLPDDATAAEGASCFVNPLTALGFLETMRLEGHSALMHTAAASNLGQMLQRICDADGVGLVNVVRRPEQVTLLRSIGAQYVVDSSAPSFTADLTAALAATRATLAFDAVGGGRLASDILACMEAAAVAREPGFNRYGSSVHKQLYIYGGLDTSPTELRRNFGMAWGVGGWLLTPFLARIGPEAAERLRRRVAAELKTTFASSYAKEISLAEVLDLEHIAVYGRRATGLKYLVNPNKGIG